MTVGGALLGQRCRLGGGHVFQPIGRFLRSAGTDIDRDVSLGSDLIEKSMNSCVPKVFGSITPPQLGFSVTTRCRRTDPVPPVIFVGKAAAGPAHVRHLNRFQRGDHVVANAASIRNAGIRADPNAVVNSMSEMLRELPENVAVNLRARLGRINRQLDSLCGQGRHSQGRRYQNSNDPS